MSNITVKRCTLLNLATLFPTAGDGEEHKCVAAITEVCSHRSDLQETPLQNQIWNFLWTDQHLAISILQIHSQAIFQQQAAELTALTEACKLAKGKTLNIYTDSRYAFWRSS